MWKLIAIVAIDLLMLPVVLTQSPTYFHLPFLAAQPSPAKSSVTIAPIDSAPVPTVQIVQKRQGGALQMTISREASHRHAHSTKHLAADYAGLWNRLTPH